ncbi:Alpha-D-ribose 1-methylphosphonate 5-triphosphate diphosphatase [Roseobacter fucihabitans]|uniref:Alpha-D-ribose 1-methylphosphonate 5-triphosphate diphosphatase n=1 Tax=Roseobacter fucihabitans TaxID=1537242 RepID=A0ABZ2BWH8_9RHOB|nr:alpha-D-ribose 1-methylphosphonate 5-triphosphate diphosphatase [Roseobacter litoralis]MBC6966877.1 Alpha-D-ribose 1-methylphosphonate 5-triphosphate diphosphatase [Roseobacter litoralis]
MTSQTTFANAKIVLPREVVQGAVTIADGLITAIDPGTAVAAGAIDCEGDYLCPGLIELHTDNLERHLSPRPRVDWPHDAAIIAHDTEMAGVGITTVFDAVRVGSIVTNAPSRYPRYARKLADEISSMRRKGALRISHHLHLRAETCSETLPDELEEFGVDDRVGIVSLMDHTPGQRQFRDMEKFEVYIRGKRGMSGPEFQDHVRHLTGLRETLGDRHERATIKAGLRLCATLASHDDTTRAQVDASASHGVSIAEFPTTREAAQACRDRGIQIVMGAPNLVRGASHSGNVAADDLAKRDLLDILSSDYVPASLLQGAVQLGALWGDMARGLATVTSNAAAGCHLADRGRIAPGLRADLTRFRLIGDVPLVRGVWSGGRRVG